MNSSQLSTTQWGTIRGSGSAKTPEENLSLCAEIFITHNHFDDVASIPNSDGILTNRHIWADRKIASRPPITRESLGEDESPTGAYISLAAQPIGDDGLGGELNNTKYEQGPKPDLSLSAHTREWDYLALHVEAAFAHYQQDVHSWPMTTLSDWQKVEALARYAAKWKMRTAKIYPSFHPVDVLFHSSFCTGSAAILQALAMVAGFETRFLAISHHSTIEIRVNGRWVWADNSWSDGAVTPATFNYAEMTSDPFAVVCFTDRQRDVYALHTARYRSPWQYSGGFYWHFLGGVDQGNKRACRNDVRDGYGLSVPYDPSTAKALYPEMKRHSFFAPKGWGPTINLSEKASLIRSAFTLTTDNALRKTFYIGACGDNPINGGIVKFRLIESADPANFLCTVDGKEITALGNGVRYKEPTVDFNIPVEYLTEGTHELCISMKQYSAKLILYPDIVEPYTPPCSDGDITVEDATFSVEPIIMPDELETLSETL